MGNHTNRGIDKLRGAKVCEEEKKHTVKRVGRQVGVRGSPPATISFFSRKSGFVIITMCVLQVCA